MNIEVKYLLIIAIILLALNLFTNKKVFKSIVETTVNIFKVVIKTIVSFVDLIILYLSIINNKLFCIVNKEKEYESLSPKDDLPKDNSYIKALKESILDSKRRNIAISGIYGSGKSSIIESFKLNNKEYKYLDISLATFVSSGEDNLENELERNILNQIFYKVKHSKMPYSRFRKIKDIKLPQILKIVSIYALLITSLTLIIKPDLIGTITSNIKQLKQLLSDIPIVGYNTNISVFIIVGVCIVTMIYIAIFLTRFILSKFTINKIQDKDGTVEFGKREDNETFNKYLDEIMYFFESAKYDVVFFEDLDRFNNLEIFTKLRALNTLINNSEAIKRKVTFVYAIKDEIFFIDESSKKSDGEEKYNNEEYIFKDRKEMNKNRTKFFDFIIPVIPVVNGENSYEILSGKIEAFNKKYGENKEIVDDALISDISFFIDDMRLLTNIYNEFLIYHRRLMIEGKNNTLNANNLFSMIVYKNLYPVDFTKLQNQSGMVYNVFSKKSDVSNKAIKKLYEEIEVCKLNIQHLEKEILEDKEELYFIYSSQWKSRGIEDIKIDENTTYNSSQLIDIEIVENIKNANRIRYDRTGYVNRNSIDFIELMTIYGSKANYYERLRAINSKGDSIEQKIKYNKNKIQNLDKQIREFKESSIKTLMNDKRFVENIDEEIMREHIIIRLLKCGYIDEMYPYYILYFYEGKLTKKDFEFIQSVFNNEELEHNFELTNVNNILEKIMIEDFESKSILNYNLLKYIITNIDEDINKLRLEKIVKCLSDLSEEDIKFILYFINKNKSEDNCEFLKLICENVQEFWSKVYSSNYVPENSQEYILVLILKYCSIKDIVLQNNGDYIKKYIELKSDFIQSIALKIDNCKLNDILIELNIKLKDISEEICCEIKNETNESYNNIIDTIYSNNSYEISSSMLTKVISFKNKDLRNENNINLSYSSIQSYNLKSLKEYIDNNIDIYIKNIFLRDSIKENTKTIIEIINNKDIDVDILNGVIVRKEFEIIDINEVDNIEVWDNLLENLKVKRSWKNILTYYYKKGGIENKLSNFINNPKTYKTLIEDDLYINELNDKKTEVIDLFVEQFIKSNYISDEVISLLSCKLGSAYIEFDFEGLSKQRVMILIEKQLVDMNEQIYKSLKTSHYGIHIYLVETNIEAFTSNKIESFDSEDLKLIIKSSKISNENIYNIIKVYNDKIDINDLIVEDLYDVIEKIVSEREVDYKLIESIMKTNLIKEKKIKLVAYQIKFLSKESISKLLESIDKEYKELIELSSNYMYLSNNEENRVLLKSLQDTKLISSFKLHKDKILIHRKRSN